MPKKVFAGENVPNEFKRLNSIRTFTANEQMGESGNLTLIIGIDAIRE